MNSSRHTISVVLTAYTEERWDQLVGAILSMSRQTRLPDQLVVVIDHNLVMLDRLCATFPGVLAVENPYEQGAAGARNAGLDHASGDLIVFFDDDMVAEPDWMERIEPIFADPRVLGVYGAAIPVWIQAQPRWFPVEFNWVVGCAYRGMPDTLAEVRNLWGCNMCIRRIVFERVGGFRSTLGRVKKHPIGTEETEICIRASQEWPQAVFLYEPLARIHHIVPPARARWSYFTSRCYFEGQSKALVVAMHGSNKGLSSERSYILCILPAGVLRGIADTLFRGDLAGVGRSAAIVVGLTFTTWGYLVGRIERRPYLVTPDRDAQLKHAYIRLRSSADEGKKWLREHAPAVYWRLRHAYGKRQQAQ